MVDDVEPDLKFELISSDGLFSGLRHLRYGTGHDDPMPFILTLTAQYVAREIGKRRRRANPPKRTDKRRGRRESALFRHRLLLTLYLAI